MQRNFVAVYLIYNACVVILIVNYKFVRYKLDRLLHLAGCVYVYYVFEIMHQRLGFVCIKQNDVYNLKIVLPYRFCTYI